MELIKTEALENGGIKLFNTFGSLPKRPKEFCGRERSWKQLFEEWKWMWF